MIRQSRNPEDEDYDQHVMQVHKLTDPVIRKWADFIGFCNYRDVVSATESGKDIGYTSGERLVRFRHSATHTAKSRVPMPAEIVLEAVHPWKQVATAIAAGEGLSRGELVKLIGKELKRIDDSTLTKKVSAAVKKTDDTEALGRYLGDLRQREGQERS